MMPLLQPNVEIMISTAMIIAPDAPKMTSAAAAPTRSLVAKAMPRSRASDESGEPPIGIMAMYDRFVSMYSSVTRLTPMTRARGIVRSGFFTSAEANVMLFQASLEKIEPTIDTAMTARRGIPMREAKPYDSCCTAERSATCGVTPSIHRESIAAASEPLDRP